MGKLPGRRCYGTNGILGSQTCTADAVFLAIRGEASPAGIEALPDCEEWKGQDEYLPDRDCRKSDEIE